MKTDDSKIVDMFLDRDEAALSCAAKKYGGRLRKISYGITESMQTAEECENDTYLEAWNRIPPHEPRTYLMAFLSRIVRTISLNRVISERRQKRFAHIESLTDEMEQCLASPVSIDKEIDEALLIDSIGRFLQTQSKKKRIIFMRRYYYLDSMRSIADQLGLKESSVRTLLTRMRRDLHQHLEKEEIV